MSTPNSSAKKKKVTLNLMKDSREQEFNIESLDDPAQLENYFRQVFKEQEKFFTLPVNDPDYQRSQKVLNDLKYELQSISHEKHVIDVLSKDILDKVQWYISPEHYDLLNYNQDQRKTYSYRQPTQAARDKAKEGEEKAELDVNKPIPLADYIPPYLRGMTAKKAEKKGALPFSSRLHAKSTQDTVLVPNVKLSSGLPSDLQNLKISPKVFEPPKKRKKKSSSSGGGAGRSVSFKSLEDPAVLQRFSRTESELLKLREQLAKTNSKFTREKNKSIEKLRSLVGAIEEKQLWQDQALLAAVDQLIGEAIGSFQDVVDETELVAILETILSHFPLEAALPVPMPMPVPMVYPQPIAQPTTAPPAEQRDYSLVHVTQRNPSNPSNPSPAQNDKNSNPCSPNSEESATQTSQLLEPSLPVEADRPVVPQIVIQQLGPPPAPLTLEPRPTVEKELVELLQTVVTSQQSTMQGQQALLLSLLQQRADRQAEAEQEEAEEPTREEPITPAPVPLAPPAPAPQQLAALPEEDPRPEPPAPLPVVEETRLEAEDFPAAPAGPTVRYNTSFGEFLLGGRQLFGRYSVTPRLPAHAYCLDDPAAVSEPRTRRRANPLTMKLLFPAEERAAKKPPAAPAVEQLPAAPTAENFLTFASKLIEAVRPAADPAAAVVGKAEITKAVHEGIALGVREVLGYFPTQAERDRGEAVGPDRYANNLGRPDYRRPYEERGQRQADDRQLHYLEAVWQRQRKASARRPAGENEAVQLAEVRREVEESRRHLARLAGAGEAALGAERNSSEYDDSLSLSETFFAMHGPPDEHPRGRRHTRGRGRGRAVEADELSALSDEEAERAAAVEESGPDDDETEEQAVSLPAVAAASLGDSEAAGLLPPLVSAALHLPETSRAVRRQNERAASRSPSVHRHGRFAKKSHRDHDEDEAAEPRGHHGGPSASSGEDSDEISSQAEADSDGPLHRDHRSWGRPALTRHTASPPLTPSLGSTASSLGPLLLPAASPFSSPALSIATADSPDGFGLVRRQPAAEYRESFHATRSALSQVRQKRRGLLSSLNSRRAELSLEAEPRAGGEELAEAVRVSLSEESGRPDPASSGQLAYDSLLSSEESSLVSQRLAALRRHNQKYRARQKAARPLGREEAGSEDIPFMRQPGEDGLSSASSASFSVQSADSSSVGLGPSLLPRSQGQGQGLGQGRGAVGGGGGFSVPLLHIDQDSYRQRPKYSPTAL